MLQHIERAGRTCYKSEDKITDDSAEKFVSMLIKRGHESVLEHCSFSVRFICDRGVSHELVRHRIASFSQESTRYVGYANAIEFIIPPWVDINPVEFELNDFETAANYPQGHPNCMLGSNASHADMDWAMGVCDAAETYLALLEQGWRPEQARSVLPNSLKTEIVMTANCREWRTVLKVRDHSAAHPQMRELMEPFHIKISGMIPGVFGD
jgi:thymidylate synthase (FAD)